MRTMTAALLALTTLAGMALADDEAKPEGDLGKMQGKWKAMVGPDKDIPIRVEIKGKEVTFSFTDQQGAERAFKGAIKLDEKAKPKEVDWIDFKGPNGDDLPPNLGIYEFEGDDKLKVCNGGPDNARPSEFREGEGGHPNILILERVKDEEKKDA